MELVVILLSSISGALIGTSVGIFMLYRKLRPITGAELDLTRGKLRSTEFSLSSATANLDNLRKQIEEREQTVQESSRQLAAAQQEAAALRQQFADQDDKVQEATKTVAETASRQAASYEAQIDANDRRIQELNGQVARLTAELEQTKGHLDGESQSRSGLEAQISTELEHSRRLASRIAELEAERSHFDLTLKEERQSAAKGIELLLMAQENLSRIFKPSAQDSLPDTNGSAVLVGVAGSPSEPLSGSLADY
jgi:peptidoglycan DL-endopeptidase CwlO